MEKIQVIDLIKVLSRMQNYKTLKAFRLTPDGFEEVEFSLMTEGKSGEQKFCLQVDQCVVTTEGLD